MPNARAVKRRYPLYTLVLIVLCLPNAEINHSSLVFCFYRLSKTSRSPFEEIKRRLNSMLCGLCIYFHHLSEQFFRKMCSLFFTNIEQVKTPLNKLILFRINRFEKWVQQFLNRCVIAFLIRYIN